MKVALRDRRFRTVQPVRSCLDIDPGRRWQPEPKARERNDASELREQGRQAAVTPVGPEGIEHLRTRERSIAIRGQERKQQPSLTARQPLLDPLAVELDNEPATQLHFRPRQCDANIVPTTLPYKGAVMSKQITCECGFVARADSDNEVVEQIREHMSSDHPELLDKVTHDDLLGWIEEV